MEKLFYKDIHITNFEATVTDCIYDEQKKLYEVILDRTAFFPEEGGQVADKGSLAGQEICDVQIKNDIISHYVKEALEPGTVVHGQVDWAQRFDFMQQHSGEHMISGLVNKHFGLDNVGFHLGLSEVTLDFNGELTLEQLRIIESEANVAVWQNLPIEISYPDSTTLTTLSYRSKLDLTENVRIVTIPGIDTCACCAPHCDTTGQIGLIKITNVQNHRGGVRVNILCGGRAVADYTEKQNSVSNISVQLSAKQNAVADAVSRLKEENLRLKELGNTLQAQLLDYAVQSLPQPNQSQHAILFVEIMNEIAIRNVINELTTKYNGYCAAFAGNDGDGYRFIIGSSSKDCRELATLLRQNFQAKGGGTAPMIQGTIIASHITLKAFLEQQ
ncbi:MAG: alanyl-tRNA editing protein [Lachnospiraceae bacterium]|nr:alanyl-tRNA editing protein [Lachnospiraceae bacterium]